MGILTILPISCPNTNTAKINLPMSYSAFANSLHWFLSNLIDTILTDEKKMSIDLLMEILLDRAIG